MLCRASSAVSQPIRAFGVCLSLVRRARGPLSGRHMSPWLSRRRLIHSVVIIGRFFTADNPPAFHSSLTNTLLLSLDLDCRFASSPCPSSMFRSCLFSCLLLTTRSVPPGAECGALADLLAVNSTLGDLAVNSSIETQSSALLSRALERNTTLGHLWLSCICG